MGLMTLTKQKPTKQDKHRQNMTNRNGTKWTYSNTKGATFNSIYCRWLSSAYPSGMDTSHSLAAPTWLCRCSWAQVVKTETIRGMGWPEPWGAPVTVLEWVPWRTHQRGFPGYAGRRGTEAALGCCGSESAAGCSGTLPGSWAWQLTWLWAAAGPGPNRRAGLWWAESQWSGQGSSVGPPLGTSPDTEHRIFTTYLQSPLLHFLVSCNHLVYVI